jgi:hypothetical protein
MTTVSSLTAVLFPDPRPCYRGRERCGKPARAACRRRQNVTSHDDDADPTEVLDGAFRHAETTVTM